MHECNCCVSSCELVEKDSTKPWRVLAWALERATNTGRGPRARARLSLGLAGGMTIGGGPAPSGPWAGRACRGRGLPRRPHRPAQPPPEHTKSRAGGYAREGTRP